MRRLILTVVFILLPAMCWPSANYFQGIVRYVTDGDTIKVFDGEKVINVRLYGIDSPEKTQKYGRQATHFTSIMALGEMATVHVVDIDKYGRAVGIVTIGSSSLNESILKAGYAWVYPAYCKKSLCDKWKQYETQAKEAKIGIWIDSDVKAPWEYRRGNRGS